MDDRCDGDMVWYVKLNWKGRKVIYNISLFATILRLQKWVLTINNLLITLIDERFELGGITYSNFGHGLNVSRNVLR